VNPDEARELEGLAKRWRAFAAELEQDRQLPAAERAGAGAFYVCAADLTETLRRLGP
jgi:hypothetical protein